MEHQIMSYQAWTKKTSFDETIKSAITLGYAEG